MTVLDKRIVSFHVRSMSAFYTLFAILNIGIGLLLVLIPSWEGWASTWVNFLALVNGALWGSGLLLFFWGLRYIDASRATPIFHTFPVFAAILAVFFLNEELSPIHWFAIVVVVLGAGTINVGKHSGGSLPGQYRASILVFLGAALHGVATVNNKFVLDHMDFWNVFALRQLTLGMSCLIPGLRKGILTKLRDQLEDRKGLVLIVFGEGLLAFLGVALTLLALRLGPVSLVATMLATRPLFVLVFSVLLSTKFWPVLNEPLRRDTIVIKALSTAMIVGGAAVLGLA